MRYKKFRITNYRGIVGPLEINVSKNSLIPIIGVNECGKTTILHAIYAFDSTNDLANNSRHIEDVVNIYDPDPKAPLITAEIDIKRTEYKRIVNQINLNHGALKGDARVKKLHRRQKEFPEVFEITRNLSTKKYSINLSCDVDADIQHALALRILWKLPYILFFDDFQDTIEEKIEIIDDDDPSHWLSILERLFNETNSTFSVYDLPEKEERQRKGILSRVKKKLNNTLTKEWRNFRLDDSDALEVSIEYVTEEVSDSVRNYLKFEIIETDTNGYQHYFFVKDRSKGFYWFFNFVMKLEFNPKVVSFSTGSIYLLDEPGSYLHANAQERLCNKLRDLSSDNSVIYCTHSHYLLNPKVIPINYIKVADKDGDGRITVSTIYEYKGTITESRSAFQPLFDALQVSPIFGGEDKDKVLIVEGIIDYYVIDILRGDKSFKVLPSVGADSIKFYISLMIAWGIEYKALWDNDEQGIAAYENAKSCFGEYEADRNFRLLPLTGKQRKCIIQDLMNGGDITLIKEECKLPSNTSFDKVIFTLYYCDAKEQVVAKISDQSKENVRGLIDGVFGGAE